MRTTLTLDDDVAAGVERLRRREGLGLSEAVNRLIREGLMIREGLTRPKRTHAYVHEARKIGMRVDVANVAEVLSVLEELGDDLGDLR